MLQDASHQYALAFRPCRRRLFKLVIIDTAILHRRYISLRLPAQEPRKAIVVY
jgi:hypothetical protein